MTQRGRRSIASLAVVTRIPGQRLPPPRGMPPDQAAIWRRVVAARPAEWFDGGSLDTLAAYCRHAADLARISARLDAMGPDALTAPDGIVVYDRLLAMRARETRGVISTARQLRLNPQALYRADKAAVHARGGPAPTGRPPWEFEAPP